jgi:ABC-type dipeptide/oligopeptide/nickel transport system permease component
MLYLSPGDPAAIFLGERQASPEQLEIVREQMGLNRPIYVQYLDYMVHAIQGDFGVSLNNGRSVLSEIMLRLPSTLELTVAAMSISTLLGITIGIIAALKHNTIIDTAAMLLALVGISMPVYWSSLLLIVLFSVNLRWFPPIGQGSLDRLVMPALALGLLSAGALARLVRSSMLEVLSQDYILTARSKGLSARVVVLRHALRNTLIPVITILGLTFGNLLSGAVLTETIFSRIGIGRMYIEAILNKDYTLVQGATLFLALAYVLINIGIDVLYAYVDPRIKYE